MLHFTLIPKSNPSTIPNPDFNPNPSPKNLPVGARRAVERVDSPIEVRQKRKLKSAPWDQASHPRIHQRAGLQRGDGQTLPLRCDSCREAARVDFDHPRRDPPTQDPVHELAGA